MNISNISPAVGSIGKKKRIGRGNASGQGRTAGKGHKGYKSRSGARGKMHFEGGQMPLMRRLPKRGMKIFSKSFRSKKKYQIINIETIVECNEKKIDINVLFSKGAIHSDKVLVKVLSSGEIKKAVDISAHKFSQNAIKKIENAGGKVTFL